MPATVSTDSAKRALLEHLIDDAGLFPPARLPMREALRAHARHNESAYAWVGGRFVAPASRLDELARTRIGDAPLDLAIVLDAATQGAKGNTIRADLHRTERVRALPGVTVSALEVRIPGPALDAGALGAAVGEVAIGWPSDPVPFWYEPTFNAGWVTPPETALAALAAARESAPANVTVGAKLRCGGPTPAALPEVDDVAAFLIAAQAHGVPWKATAGLHHPVRGRHGETETAHGFLNVFLAGVLLHAGAIEPSAVVDVLAEEDARAFQVDPLHVGWRDARVEAEAVAAARAQCVAFGSCSFDEPVNGLRELGLLA
ncbi:MAG TPA: hypothetical protein VMD91_13220 [Candidatus Sulfotelmatobacter sp.]|nr:hypothetical protein [Candidatus Sulfotelmatobacter sp.]